MDDQKHNYMKRERMYCKMDTWINSFKMLFSSGSWMVIKALLILVIAFIVSAGVKKVIMKIMEKTLLGRFFHFEDAESVRCFVGKLGYLLVFLLFVPGIFQTLEMDSISVPLMELLNSLWSYIPNVFASAIILTIGIRISNLIRQLMVPLLEKTKVDKLQEKLGVSIPKEARISETIAYIVYVLILIPVAIAALNALGITAISQPATAMLDTIINFIPNLTVSIILACVGILIGKLAGQIVERLISASGISQKLALFTEQQLPSLSVAKVAGQIVNVIIVVFLLVEAFRVLRLQVLTVIGSAIIAYMPSVLAALCILLLAIVLSTIVSKILKQYNVIYAVIAKTSIMVVCVFFILSQLGIASKLVNAAFIIMISAVAVAFAISFGIGGRSFAANMLHVLEVRITQKKTLDSGVVKEGKEK